MLNVHFFPRHHVKIINQYINMSKSSKNYTEKKIHILNPSHSKLNPDISILMSLSSGWADTASFCSASENKDQKNILSSVQLAFLSLPGVLQYYKQTSGKMKKNFCPLSSYLRSFLDIFLPSYWQSMSWHNNILVLREWKTYPSVNGFH